MPDSHQPWQPPPDPTPLPVARAWGLLFIAVAIFGLCVFVVKAWIEEAPRTYVTAVTFSGHGRAKDRLFALPRLGDAAKIEQESLLRSLKARLKCSLLELRGGDGVCDFSSPTRWGEAFTTKTTTLKSDLKPEDVIIISLLAHGASGKNDDRVGWILTDEFAPTGLDENSRPGGAIKLEQVLGDVAASMAGTKIVLLDACRLPPDSLVGVDDEFARTANEAMRKLHEDTNIWVILPCENRQRSHTSRVVGTRAGSTGSVFVAAVKDVLESDDLAKSGELRLNEFFAAVKTDLERRSGGLQTPVLLRAGHGRISADDVQPENLSLGSVVQRNAAATTPEQQDARDAPGADYRDDETLEWAEIADRVDLTNNERALGALFAPNLWRRLRWESQVSTDDDALATVNPHESEELRRLNAQAIDAIPDWQLDKSALVPNAVKNWRSRKLTLLNAFFYAPYYSDVFETVRAYQSGLSPSQVRELRKAITAASGQYEILASVLPSHFATEDPEAQASTASIADDIAALASNHQTIMQALWNVLSECRTNLDDHTRAWSLANELTAVAITNSPLLPADACQQMRDSLTRIVANRSSPLEGEPVDKVSEEVSDEFTKSVGALRENYDALVRAVDKDRIDLTAGRALAARLRDPRLTEYAERQLSKPLYPDGEPWPELPGLDATLQPFATTTDDLQSIELSYPSNSVGTPVMWRAAFQVGGYGVKQTVYASVTAPPEVGLQCTTAGAENVDNDRRLFRLPLDDDGRGDIELSTTRTGEVSASTIRPPRVQIQLFADRQKTTPIKITPFRRSDAADEDDSPSSAEWVAGAPLDAFGFTPELDVPRPVLTMMRYCKRRGKLGWHQLQTEDHHPEVAQSERVLRGFCDRDTRFRFQFSSGSARPRDYKIELRLFNELPMEPSPEATKNLELWGVARPENVHADIEPVPLRFEKPDATDAGESSSPSSANERPAVGLVALVYEEGSDQVLASSNYVFDVASPRNYVDVNARIKKLRSVEVAARIRWDGDVPPDVNAQKPIEIKLSSRDRMATVQDPQGIVYSNKADDQGTIWARLPEGGPAGVLLELDVDRYPRAVRLIGDARDGFTENAPARVDIVGVFAAEKDNDFEQIKAIKGLGAKIIPCDTRQVEVRLRADAAHLAQGQDLQVTCRLYSGDVARRKISTGDRQITATLKPFDDDGNLVVQINVADIRFLLRPFFDTVCELVAEVADAHQSEKLIFDCEAPDLEGVELADYEIKVGTAEVPVTVRLHRTDLSGVQRIEYGWGGNEGPALDDRFEPQTYATGGGRTPFKPTFAFEAETEKLDVGQNHVMWVRAIDYAKHASEWTRPSIPLWVTAGEPPDSKNKGADDEQDSDASIRIPPPEAHEFVVRIESQYGKPIGPNTNKLNISPPGARHVGGGVWVWNLNPSGQKILPEDTLEVAASMAVGPYESSGEKEVKATPKGARRPQTLILGRPDSDDGKK